MAGGLPHNQRIPKAREWVSSYMGDSLIKTYQKRMSVDRMTAVRDLGELDVLSDERVSQIVESDEKRKANEAKQQETAAYNRMAREIEGLPPEIRDGLVTDDGFVYYMDGTKKVPWVEYRLTLIADEYITVKRPKAERWAEKAAKKAARKPHKRVCPNCGQKMTQ